MCKHASSLLHLNVIKSSHPLACILPLSISTQPICLYVIILSSYFGSMLLRFCIRMWSIHHIISQACFTSVVGQNILVFMLSIWHILLEACFIPFPLVCDQFITSFSKHVFNVVSWQNISVFVWSFHHLTLEAFFFTFVFVCDQFITSCSKDASLQYLDKIYKYLCHQFNSFSWKHASL
jgi:hypothetical protein